jgi:hypothetical protein
VRACADAVGFLLPADFAADLVLEGAVDIELQVITILLGGDLPIELDRLSAVGLDNGLQAGFAVVRERVVSARRVEEKICCLRNRHSWLSLIS